MEQSASVPSRRLWQWLVPSLSHWLWLVFVVMLLQPAQRTAMVASDGDACMHWRVGEHMLQTRQIIRADVFSHTRAGQPIISKEWLSEIIFAAAGRLGGLYGLCFVAALVIATTVAVLHAQIVREGNDILIATLVALLASFAASSHWLARPHVFTFLLLVLWHDSLRRFERGGEARRLAISLGVLTLLWVNLHGGYLAGFLVLGAYWVGALLQRDYKRLRVLSGVAAVCAVVSLANPNGYQLHLHNLQFLRSDYLTNLLGEYRSPNFHSPESRGFLVWLALIFFTLALRRPRLSVAAGLVLISWTYFALYAVRNIPLMALLTAPLITPALSELARGRWLAMSQRLRRVHDDGRGGLVVCAAAIVAVISMNRETTMPDDRWPVDAVRFIGEDHERFAGNMFNQYTWGGYLLQVLPEHKVFVDGRTDFYGESLIREFDDTSALHTNWTVALTKYNVDWTLMPTDHRLNLALEASGWQRVYSNKVATIFLRGQ